MVSIGVSIGVSMEGGEIVIPDYKLNARARWDRYHLTTVSTRLGVEQLEAFDAACEAAGVSRYEAVRRFCVAAGMRPETVTALKWRRRPSGKGK